MSIALYLRTKPLPREGQAFATKHGWAVPNRFDNKGFSIAYEIFGLDQILYENFLTPEGCEVKSDDGLQLRKFWAETVNKYGFDAFTPFIADAVKDFNSTAKTLAETAPQPAPTQIEFSEETPPSLPVMDEGIVHGDLPNDANSIPTPPVHLTDVGNVDQFAVEPEDFGPETVDPAELIVEPEVVETTEPTATKYTFDQLMAMEMEDVRSIGNVFGVKDKSKERLANKIIDLQG